MLDLSVGIAFKTTKKEETSVGYNINCSKYGIFWIICLTWLVKALFDLMFPPFQEFPLSFGTFFQPALCARSVPDLAWWTLRTMSTLTNRLAVFYISFSFRVFRIMNFPKTIFSSFPSKKRVFFFRLLQCTARKSLILSTLILCSVMVKGSDYVGFEGGGRTDPKIIFALKVKSISCTFFMLHNVTSCSPAIQHRCWLWAKFTKDSCARWSSEEDWD